LIFVLVSAYKEDRTQNYHPVRTFQHKFSVASFSVNYSKTPKLAKHH